MHSEDYAWSEKCGHEKLFLRLHDFISPSVRMALGPTQPPAE